MEVGGASKEVARILDAFKQLDTMSSELTPTASAADANTSEAEKIREAFKMRDTLASSVHTNAHASDSANLRREVDQVKEALQRQGLDTLQLAPGNQEHESPSTPEAAAQSLETGTISSVEQVLAALNKHTAMQFAGHEQSEEADEVEGSGTSEIEQVMAAIRKHDAARSEQEEGAKPAGLEPPRAQGSEQATAVGTGASSDFEEVMSAIKQLDAMHTATRAPGEQGAGSAGELDITTFVHRLSVQDAIRKQNAVQLEVSARTSEVEQIKEAIKQHNSMNIAASKQDQGSGTELERIREAVKKHDALYD